LSPRIQTPHPALRATFSRKGRREEAARACTQFVLATDGALSLPLPLWERVGVRGSGLSINRNPSPGSHLSMRHSRSRASASFLRTAAVGSLCLSHKGRGGSGAWLGRQRAHHLPLRRDGGHGANAPLPTLRILSASRPRERGDPYAAAALWAQWLTASAPTKAGGYGSQSLPSGRQQPDPLVRRDDDQRAPLTTVIPRECGVSSTPRPSRFNH
jgi:hypothetical protein